MADNMTPAARAAYNEYMREWRAKHKELVNKYNKNWRDNNPDKVQKSRSDYWERKAAERAAVNDESGG